MSIRESSRHKERKSVIPFGDIMLPVIGLVAVGLLIVGVKLFFSYRRKIYAVYAVTHPSSCETRSRSSNPRPFGATKRSPRVAGACRSGEHREKYRGPSQSGVPCGLSACCKTCAFSCTTRRPPTRISPFSGQEPLGCSNRLLHGATKCGNGTSASGTRRFQCNDFYRTSPRKNILPGGCACGKCAY